MPRHIVCLSFDFDATSIWIARGMVSPGPISRGEFGVIGAARILSLLKKYGLHGTWFIPGHTLETYPQACEAILQAGHEIGNHGWTHMSPTAMSGEEEEAELLRANESIRRATGHYPKGYRSPVWDQTPRTVELLLKHGFVYESNLMGNDYSPYRARTPDTIDIQKPLKFGDATPLIEIPVSWSLDDAPHFELVRTPNWVQPGLMNAAGVLENWVNEFGYMADTTSWGALTYTFHPYCIGRGYRMVILEKLIQELLKRDAIFLRMEELATEFDERFPFSHAMQ